MSEKEEIIHQSKWATTVRVGKRIKKYYLYDNPEKISKETELLRLSSNLPVSLIFDEQRHQWVQEMPYISNTELFAGDSLHILERLKDMVSLWDSDGRFLSLVSDNWEAKAKPYWKNVLETYGGTAAAVCYLSKTSGEHFIHGDFQIMNVLRNPLDELIVIDFENAGVGPELWDETTMVYSLVQERKYALAKQAYSYFRCDKQMLECIAAIRLAQAKKKDVGIEKREYALTYVMENFD